MPDPTPSYREPSEAALVAQDEWPEGIDREHGSTVEQVHRILTTEAYREVDPWTVAEEIVALVKRRTAWRGPRG